jgi:hypothetical protein
MPNTTDSRRFYGFDPTVLPNCAIWLDGSDSGTILPGSIDFGGGVSLVTQWSDKSGNNRHATAAVGRVISGQVNNIPTYQTGTNYITFLADGVTQIGNSGIDGWTYFDCPGLSALGGSQGLTLFFVTKRNSNKNNSTTSGSYLTGGTSINTNERLHCGYFYSTSAPVSDRIRIGYWSNDLDLAVNAFETADPIRLIRFRHTDQNVRTTAINGFTIFSQTPPGYLSTTYPNPVIGSREPFVSGNTSRNNGFDGRIYEIIAYNRGLTDDESRQVESYLSWKYQILQDSTVGYGEFTPTNINNCALWLDAADSATLFQTRGTTTPVTEQGDNVRRWLNKGSAGSFAQDLCGTSNIFPKYQNGGVYIFNQNSNNYSAATLCSMAIQTNFQTTADYSVIAVVDFADTGSGRDLQTVYRG